MRICRSRPSSAHFGNTANKGEKAMQKKSAFFICHCGTNIAATVDVKAVAEALKHEPGVVFSTDYPYMLGSGPEYRQDAIRDYHLSGVVICSCRPACTRPPSARRGSGRPQTLWWRSPTSGSSVPGFIGISPSHRKSHYPPASRHCQSASERSPLCRRKPGCQAALVIGGGIAGIRPLDIADAGFPVDIVETKPPSAGR